MFGICVTVADTSTGSFRKVSLKIDRETTKRKIELQANLLAAHLEHDATRIFKTCGLATADESITCRGSAVSTLDVCGISEVVDLAMQLRLGYTDREAKADAANIERVALSLIVKGAAPTTSANNKTRLEDLELDGA